MRRVNFFDGFSSSTTPTTDIIDFTKKKVQNSYNDTGGAIAAFRMVKAVDHESTEDVPKINLMTAFDERLIGLTTESISDSAYSEILEQGIVEVTGFDTTLATLEDPVYSDATGNLTLTKTSVEVGIVLSLAANGVIYINMSDAKSAFAGVSTDYVDLNLDLSPAVSSKEGRISWNNTDLTINVDSGLGPVGQVLEESWVLIYNDTGSQIDNGSVLYTTGASGGKPTVDLADSTTHETCSGELVVATMDIADGAFGIACDSGNVRGLNTNSFDLGDVLYVSDTPGVLTNVKPSFPDYVIQIAVVTTKDATDGEIQVKVKGTPDNTIVNFWNGVFRESFDFTVDSDGATITGSLEPSNGHDDMTMMFSDGFTILNTNPAATIALTAGTDEIPQTNYVYIPKSTKVLTVSTSDWITAEHIKVAEIVLQSAATTQIEGALRNQNWNDHVQSTNTDQGHLSHICEKLRQFEAQWDSGAEGSAVIADAGASAYVKNTAGVVYQMHKQNFQVNDMTPYTIDAVSQGSKTFTISGDGDLSAVFPDGRLINIYGSTGNDGYYTIVSTSWSDPDFVITVSEAIPSAVADGTVGDNIHVVNDFTTLYDNITNLTDITTDSAGVTLTNTSFSLVVWGVQNKTGQPSHLMCNVPSGSYSKNFPEQAVTDASGYSIYDIPKSFQGVGFLIARFTFINSGGAWSLEDTEDLRGRIPNTTAGGGAGGAGVTTFTGLTDTPSAYTGQAGKVATVNVGETALEFTNASGGLIDGTDARLGVETIDGSSNAVDTDIDVYSPSSGYAYGIKVVISNFNSSEVAKVRVANRDGAIANEDYLVYDISIGAGSEPIVIMIPGMTSSETITVRSDVTDVNFAVYGQTLTDDESAYCLDRLDITAADTDEDVASFTAENEVDIVVCNRNTSETANVIIKLADTAVEADEDIIYQGQILPNQSKAISLDLNVANAYKVVAQSSHADATVQVYGRGTTQFETAMILPAEVQLKTTRESGLFLLSGAQSSGLSVNDQVQFDTTDKNHGIIFDSINNQWTLKANKRYNLRAICSIGTSAATSILGYKFYDVTNGAYLSTLEGAVNALSYSYAGFNNPETVAEITPETDIVVELRISTNTAVNNIFTTTFAEIRETEALVDYVKNPYQIDYYNHEVTVTGSNWTTTGASFRPFKDPNGNWYADVSIDGDVTGSPTGLTLTVTGVTFKTGIDQTLAVRGPSAYSNARIPSGTATIVLDTGAAMTAVTLSGIVKLDGKPTWL